jgi:FKBP-type peptidyl-prolyl cis-trans isomerase 2
MATVKKKDFIQVGYTGKFKEDGTVFDTTSEDTAKKNNLHDTAMKYGDIVICLGEGQILAGLEEQLVGKEVGKELEIEIPAEKAFGKKDAKLIKLVPTNAFRKEKIQAVPGLQVNMDGMVGTIKTVTGGRTLVDFNHPLSGKDVVYTVKITKVITDTKEKVESFLKMSLNTKDVKATIEGDAAKIEIKSDFPAEMNKVIEDKLKEIVPEIKKIEFSKEKSDKVTKSKA